MWAGHPGWYPHSQVWGPGALPPGLSLQLSSLDMAAQGSKKEEGALV